MADAAGAERVEWEKVKTRRDWEQFREWSDAAVGTADPDIELDNVVALGQLYEYFTKLIDARRSGEVAGQDDLLSILGAIQPESLPHLKSGRLKAIAARYKPGLSS